MYSPLCGGVLALLTGGFHIQYVKKINGQLCTLESESGMVVLLVEEGEGVWGS